MLAHSGYPRLPFRQVESVGMLKDEVDRYHIFDIELVGVDDVENRRLTIK